MSISYVARQPVSLVLDHFTGSAEGRWSVVEHGVLLETVDEREAARRPFMPVTRSFRAPKYAG
jgi:hypothetical protein